MNLLETAKEKRLNYIFEERKFGKEDFEINGIEIVRRILERLGKMEDLIGYVTDRPGHDRRCAIDNTKITTQLGWRNHPIHLSRG